MLTPKISPQHDHDQDHDLLRVLRPPPGEFTRVCLARTLPNPAWGCVRFLLTHTMAAGPLVRGRGVPARTGMESGLGWTVLRVIVCMHAGAQSGLCRKQGLTYLAKCIRFCARGVA